ncbi:MAG: tetratricopeptide repeat protein [Pseudomonadota bacterium]
MRKTIVTTTLAGLACGLWVAEVQAEKVVRKSSSSDQPAAQSAEGDEETREDIDEGTMTPHKAPPIEGLPEEEARPSLRETLQREANRPYDNIVYIGADVLRMDPEFVHGARQGLEQIYLRDYPAAMEQFGALDKRWPETAVGPVGRGLIFQSLMLENFDFKYEGQYESNWAEARRRVTAATEVPGNDAWDYFMLVGVIGVEAMHATRKYQYVDALGKAYEAKRALDKCRESAPDFPDLVLADGIYDYWRSVVALNTKLIPDGEDKRAQGIEEMKYVETHGIFVSAPTILALTFTYLEERDLKRAMATSVRGHLHYPKNVINNLLLARIYLYMRRVQEAEQTLNQVLVDAPDNERVHYYLSLVYGRTKRLDQAITELEKYLGYQLIDEYRATSLYRLGGLYYRKHEYAKAMDNYEKAYAVNKHRGAKRRIESMKKAKKDGRIDF